MQIQGERTSFSRPKWELKPKSQPHPAKRWCHTATTHGSHLYLMGGRLAQSAKPKEYAYRIDCQTFNCEPILLSDNPLMRQSHSCALINDSMYVLFGINKAAKVLNDCLHLKITPNSLIWQKKNQISELEPRESHMSVILEDRYILIYGGLNTDEKLIEDFHIYDLQRQSWKKISKVEGEIQGKVGGTLINIKNQIYLFGGQINDQNQYSNQIYKIQIHHYKDSDETQETFIQILKLNLSGPKPLPRSQFAATVYKDRYLIVVGGQGPSKEKNESVKLLNDIWAFDTEKLSWQEIIPQNPNHFKPRSSFTANIYKQNLIIFGGLVSLKDFKSSDELYVLNLSSEVQRKPICNLCKSSFKSIPKQEVQVEKSKGIENRINFKTSLSTIFAISRTIQDPFAALGTLFHSFDNFQIEKCAFICSNRKLRINLKTISISDIEWKHILESYDFVPLIHQQNERVRKSISNKIRQNLVNYLSYNIKNTCFRLGNQMMISFINSKQELEICLMNKYGIYQLTSSAPQNVFQSQTSIIMQFMKEYEITMSSLFQNGMSIFVTNLKPQSNNKYKKQIHFDSNFKDIACNNRLLKDYLRIAFAQPLSYQIGISKEQISFLQTQRFNRVGFNDMQNEKWSQTNNYPEFFQQILTYYTEGCSQILVYKQNKLMHSKKIDSLKETIIQLHLTNNIEPNLTFSDVMPSQELIASIKSFVLSLKQNNFFSNKRQKSLARQEEQYINPLEQKDLNEQPNKIVKKTDEIQEGEL